MLYSNNIEDMVYLSPDAAKFLAEHDMSTLPCGRYDLNENEYVNVMEYTTKDRKEGNYEAHRKYIDVQMVIAGSEIIEVCNIDCLTATTDFDVEADYVLYSNEQIGDQYLLSPGKFIAVMPNDGHMPSLNPTESASQNKKAVFKLLAR